MNIHYEKFVFRVLDMTLEKFIDGVISETAMLELFDKWCEYVSKHNN